MLGAPDGTGSVGWFNLGTGFGDEGEDPEGFIIISFDDNVVIPSGSTADDLSVWEASYGPILNDTADVFVSEDGVTWTFVGVARNRDFVGPNNSFPNDFDIDPTGLAFVKYVKLVNTMAGIGAPGFDTDAIEGLTSIGTDDIVKDFATNILNQTGDIDEIDVGTGIQQFKAFTIEITNNTGTDGGLSGLTFFDVVPAEFDLDDAPVAGAGCAVTTSNPPGATANGKNKSKLEPEFISINAGGLDDGLTCTVTVNVKTDSKSFPKGNSPAYTPTSCLSGTVVLNDGVRIIHNATGATIFEDDDSLALTCTS